MNCRIIEHKIDLLQCSFVDLLKGGVPVRTVFTGSFHVSGDSRSAGIKRTPATRWIQPPAYVHTGGKMAFQKRTVNRQIEGDSGKSRGSKRISGSRNGRSEKLPYVGIPLGANAHPIQVDPGIGLLGTHEGFGFVSSWTFPNCPLVGSRSVLGCQTGNGVAITFQLAMWFWRTRSRYFSRVGSEIPPLRIGH